MIYIVCYPICSARILYGRNLITSSFIATKWEGILSKEKLNIRLIYNDLIRSSYEIIKLDYTLLKHLYKKNHENIILLFKRDLALFLEVFIAHLLFGWNKFCHVGEMTFLYLPKKLRWILYLVFILVRIDKAYFVITNIPCDVIKNQKERQENSNQRSYIKFFEHFKLFFLL